MSIIFAGNPDGPHLRKEEPVWKRGVGWQTRQTWEGTARAIKASVPTWIVDADSVELDLDGLVGTAYVTYAKDIVGNPDATVTPEAEAETVWELDGNDIVKDLWEHPDLAALDEDVVAEIKKQINNWDSGTTYSLTDIDEDHQGWFALMVKGVRQFTTTQWVLRKTVTAPRTYPNQVSLAGIGELWTSAQITGIPNSVLFDISQIPAPTVPSAFLWSWLKKSPRVSRTSSGRFQMIEEWWLDAWSLKDLTLTPQQPGLYVEYTP